MIKELYDALMRRVYSPITAVISFSKDGTLLDMVMMDALLPSLEELTLEQGDEFAVIFSHPEGRMSLYKEDRITLNRLEQLCGDRPLRAYLCGEDIDCYHVDRERYCAADVVK